MYVHMCKYSTGIPISEIRFPGKFYTHCLYFMHVVVGGLLNFKEKKRKRIPSSNALLLLFVQRFFNGRIIICLFALLPPPPLLMAKLMRGGEGKGREEKYEMPE